MTRLALALLLLLTPALAAAGTLVNNDDAEYGYAIYWDDLSPIEKGVIAPHGVVVIQEKTGIVELVGQHDNIYIRPEETVTITDGILQQGR